MKTSERHQLKANPVAERLAVASAWLSERGARVAWTAALVLVLAVAIGVFWAWRQRAQERASALLAEAMVITDAQIVEAGSGTFPATTNTYPTERARSEAAVAKFQAVLQEYPSSRAAVTARYELASLLVSLGRPQEAEQQYRELADSDRGIHGRMARMALAELQVNAGRYDEAIQTYRDAAARKDEELPVDGVLMQLGRAYTLAGKRAEALQTYQRIVSEFPDSIYAAEAKRVAEELKAQAAS
jgi:TolA-binding protein